MLKLNMLPGTDAWIVDTTNKVSVEPVEILDRHQRPGHPNDIEYTVRYYNGGRVYRYSQYLVFPCEADAYKKLRKRVENRLDRDLRHAAKMQKWLDEHEIKPTYEPVDGAPEQGQQADEVSIWKA